MDIAVAVISALSGLAGGLFTAIATRSLEKQRFDSSLRKEAEERRLAAAQAFSAASFAWFQWLQKMVADSAGWSEGGVSETDRRNGDEMDRRGRERAQAYRELQLLASPALFRWIRDTYDPAEYAVRKHVAMPVSKWEAPIEPEATESMRRFSGILYSELIEQLRPEVAALRDPAGA
jgi:hypothetical protein